MALAGGETVEGFSRFVLRCFRERREPDYVDRCALPMLVYSDSGAEIALAPTRCQAIEMLRAAWDNLRAVAAAAEGRVVAVGMPQPLGFPARIDWILYDSDGNRVMTSELRYFLRRAPSGLLRIELTEVFGPGCSRPVEAPPASRCA